MSQKSYLTQCPFCGVKFQVTSEQMNAAKGSVRCGSCLKVFKANENIIKKPRADGESSPAETQAKAKPARNKWGLDDESGEQKSSPSQKPAPQRPSTPAQPAAAVENDADDTDEGQEDGDKPAGNNTKISLSGLELNDALFGDNGDTQSISGDAYSDLVLNQDTDSGSEAADEEWARAMLEEIENEGRVDVSRLTADDFQLENTGRSEPDRENKPRQREAVQSASLSDDFLDEFADAEDGAVDSFDFLQGDAIDIALEETPSIALAAARARDIDWLDIGKWSGLSLAALLVLYLQYFIFYFDDIALNPEKRPSIERLCTTLGCELPPLSQIDQIRGAQLIVRSHDKYANAVMVDAIIYNRAAFSQPFPNIELIFNDREDQLIASRIFTPREYLHGELRKMDSMPVDTPIHIAFELADPGDKARNYVMQFHPPEIR